MSFECVTQHNVNERVYAAVGIPKAYGHIVGIEEHHRWMLNFEVHQLKNVIRCPANEEGRTDCYRCSGNLLGPHTEVPLWQRDHHARDVLLDLDIDHTDNEQWDDERQKELVEGVPIYVDR